MVENGPHPLRYRLIQSVYAYPFAAPTPLNSLSVWGIRSKSHLLIRSRSNEIKCIVIGKPARIKGTRGEGVPPRIHPRKLIIHRKWNEHTRGFSTSDRWSNLKEFMSERARVHARPGGSKHAFASRFSSGHSRRSHDLQHGCPRKHGFQRQRCLEQLPGGLFLILVPSLLFLNPLNHPAHIADIIGPARTKNVVTG